MQYGQFDTFEAFLNSYERSQRAEEAVADLSLESKKARARRRKDRNVVEVKARVAAYLGTESDNASHQHIKISIEEVLELDPDVEKDLARIRQENEVVFVSVRYGDRAGLEAPLSDSEVEVGDPLHLRGEWIPRDKAYAHGGELMSVLHFTHRPLGFICSEERCYD